MTNPAPDTNPGKRKPMRRGVPAVAAAMALAASALLVPGTAQAASTVANPGFESGLTGWSVSGPAGSAKTEAGGYQSTNRLTHWLSTSTTVTTSQTLTGLASGWWTFRANIKSGGPVNSSKLVLSGCGTDGSTVLPSTETDDKWLSLAVSANVTTGTCTLKLSTTGTGAWASMDGVTFTQGKIDRKVRGADLSGVPKNEANGAAYAWNDGTAVDSVAAFAETGTNLVRLKVWVNPADGYNMKAQVVAMAQRAQAKGMKVLIDFHYSDRWTDPGAQGIPAAWQGLNPAGLADAVYNHTRDVMSALKAAGITPYGAQIGNEINPGMLWPYGQTTDVNPNDNVVGPQWDNLASFLKAGARAVTEVSPTTKKVLHLTNLDKGVSGLSWWFDEVTARAVPFDIIGLSYYGYWHGTLANLQGAVTSLSSRFNKDVIVVETSYPFTLADNPNAPWENVITSTSQLVKNYPATPAGQAANFRAVQDVVASAPGGRGLGAVYWEPAWTSVPGNGWDPADPSSGNAWENQAVFDYNNRALPAINEFWPDPASTVNLP
ncbi:glycoside hydrolase family 53 protein [Pseudarthrobacter sp. DSP2-3-2b1]|uniref:glycoside hydrolase family 53 protein n=1 Tax=Pseudarthrobacter sp. DSP2-3-2b1 TaxID=2804661 RepID=UPI003CEF0154